MSVNLIRTEVPAGQPEDPRRGGRERRPRGEEAAWFTRARRAAGRVA